MDYQIFISFAGPDMDLIENFRDYLMECFGIPAWVYSVDKSLSEEIWREIESRIQSSSIMIFAVSGYTDNSEGQKKELELAFDKIEKTQGDFQCFPLALRDTPFRLFPQKLRHINGKRLNASNVKSVAFDIASQFFPQLFEAQRTEKWKIPVPGEWLEICGMDEFIEEYFALGDKLYFRRVSQMGLFECFAPKINSLFWVDSRNLKPALLTDEDKDMERNIPYIYTVMGQIQIEKLGWDAWHKQQK